MPTDDEIKSSLKEKLYHETLDEIAQKIRSGEVNNKPRYWLNWDEMITVQHNMGGMRIGEPKRFTSLDIENAVKLAINKTLDEARTDTSNQIFEELEKVAWQRIEPSRLAEFYEQFCNAKDPEAALKVAIAFSIIGFDAEKYEAIRKRYKVD